MDWLVTPFCSNHPSAPAVAVVHSDGNVERFVCATCTARFWRLTDVVGGPAATLTYL